MDILMTLIAALLFFFQIPGLFFSLSKSGNKYVIAATHAFLFALTYALTQVAVYKFFPIKEGFGSYTKPTAAEAAAATAAATAAAAEAAAAKAAAAKTAECLPFCPPPPPPPPPRLDGKDLSKHPKSTGVLLWGSQVCTCR